LVSSQSTPWKLARPRHLNPLEEIRGHADRKTVLEKRMESRTAIMAIVEVSWEEVSFENEAGVPQTARGKLEDTSRHGASIRIGKPIVVGSKIHLKWHREEFSGVVRSCRQSGLDFILGIKRDPKEPTG
jgi:hypothetical protein